MKKSLVIFFFFAALPALLSQSNDKSPKKYFFGARVSARLASFNVTDTTVWSAPRLGVSAGVAARFQAHEHFFILAGYELCQHAYYDNLNSRYLKESNNSLFLELNLSNARLSDKYSSFVGVGAAFDFSNSRSATQPGAYVYAPDEGLRNGDYFVPLHFVFGLQKMVGNEVRNVSIALAKNIFASNKAGAINTNTLVVKLQYSHLF